MPIKVQQVEGEFKFKNVHGNYYEDFDELVRIYNDETLEGYAAYNDTSDKIRAVITRAKNLKKRLRACGSLWSLSKAPYGEGICVFSYDMDDEEAMQFATFLDASDSTGVILPENLLFTQCGNRIMELSKICEENGQSLKTSGASNGQTIAGAIGTGVHGSSIKVGSIQDTVKALHIIHGETLNESVIIQAETEKAVTEAFASKINAKLVSDDNLFHSALVGLGCFGYVHGVIVETEKLFHLANYIVDVTQEQFLKYCETESLSEANIEVNSGIGEQHLYHVKFYINQYNLKARAEIIYKILDESLSRPKFLKYNKDFGLNAGKLFASILPEAIPSILNKQLPPIGNEFGKLSQIFGNTDNLRDGQFSCAISVPIKEAHVSIGKIIQRAQQLKKIPCMLSLRFVPRSKATIAFTKYDMNCLIGIDGMDTKVSRNFIEEIYNTFLEESLDHTWHWGKINPLDANFVKKTYGNKLTIWQESRTKLLGANTSVFVNDYVQRLGLTKTQIYE